jgi:hypothetical protein
VRRGVFIVLGLLAVLATAGTASSAGLRTGIVDPARFEGADPSVSFARTQAVGGSIVRLILNWRQVAPATRPGVFDPTNPADPAYTWTTVDRQVAAAKSAGLEPILVVQLAPDWAEGAGSGPEGTNNVDPVEFGNFAKAAARRYSGTFQPDPYTEALPRVRYWQAWNEPNRDYFFRPQYVGRTIQSAVVYRNMVNQFATAVHGVNSTNLVVAGALAPLGRPGKPSPMAFMKAFLSQKVTFDVWSHHPYTSGGPLHKAQARGDVTLGNLPTMRAYLNSMKRIGRIRGTKGVQFWVTEFSWDSKPPDPAALSQPLHARWTSEALYRMWQNGISAVVWFRIQDDPLTGPLGSPYQSGFYTTAGKRKASFEAFRFPVVALRQKRGIMVWGRTPTSQSGKVTIQIKTGRRWRNLTSLRANSYGLFTRTYRVPYVKGYVRARFAGETSIPFSLTYVKDRYVNPFGCGGQIHC